MAGHRVLASGRCPSGYLCSRSEPELGQDVLDVTLCGSLRNNQLGGDLSIGHPFRHQPGNLELSRGQGRVIHSTSTPCDGSSLLAHGERDRSSPLELFPFLGENTPPLYAKPVYRQLFSVLSERSNRLRALARYRRPRGRSSPLKSSAAFEVGPRGRRPSQRVQAQRHSGALSQPGEVSKCLYLSLLRFLAVTHHPARHS